MTSYHATPLLRELIVPAELPGESSAVWHRHGRCEDVLAELFELP